MVGDLADIAGRIRAMLPKRWFADNAPNLSALLLGMGTPFAWLFGLIDYVTRQSRLATATDSWLDIAAVDFLGTELPRRAGEPDSAYRLRIQHALFRETGTRSALTSTITVLTGAAPHIFEPARCADTGVYGSLGDADTLASPFAYNQAGGWGNLHMPYQFFVSAARPATPGVADLSGYTCSAGAYGGGQIAYVDLAQLPGAVSDAEIQAQVNRVLPVNSTAWLRIT